MMPSIDNERLAIALNESDKRQRVQMGIACCSLLTALEREHPRIVSYLRRNAERHKTGE